MSDAVAEQPTENETLWTNTADGNNHSLVWKNGFLMLNIGKPDTPMFSTDPVKTITPLVELKQVFASLGPKWNPVSGKEVKQGDRYQDEREAMTSLERIVWTVDHTKLNVRNVQYNVADTLRVLLKGKS